MVSGGLKRGAVEDLGRSKVEVIGERRNGEGLTRECAILP